MMSSPDLIAREVNPFASTCGWVCGAPCEAACRRGKIDSPVAIRALKRFVDDRYGVYLGQQGDLPPLPWRDQPPESHQYTTPETTLDLGNSTFPHSLGQLRGAAKRGERTGQRVAVVGAGPAGLTCTRSKLAVRAYAGITAWGWGL